MKTAQLVPNDDGTFMVLMEQDGMLVSTKTASDQNEAEGLRQKWVEGSYGQLNG